MRSKNVTRSLLPALALLAACSTSSSPSSPPSPAPSPQTKDLRELHALVAHPQSCASIDECPVGSYCDAKTTRCAWDCYASSDCGGHGNVCSSSGRCTTPAESAAEPPRAGVPRKVVQTLTVGTTGVGGTCSVDSDCAAGAYCADATKTCAAYVGPGAACTRSGQCTTGSECLAGTCAQFVAAGSPCTYDEECGPTAYCDALHSVCTAGCTSATSCGSGLACGSHGRCVSPSATTTRPHLTLSSAGVNVVRPTDPGTTADHVQPMTLKLTASDASYLPGGGTPSPHVQLTASPGAEINCDPAATTAPTTGFGPTCSLQAWTFAGTASPYTATATIWIRLSTSVQPLDQMWQVAMRSTDASIDSDSIVVQLPENLRLPPAYDGEYQGRLVLEGSDIAISSSATGLPALDIPITATASAQGIVLFDPTRQVSATGTLFFSLTNPANSYLESWITTDPATPQSSEPLADTGDLSSRITQEGTTLTVAGGVLSGHVDVALGLTGTSKMRWRFDIHRVGDLAHTSCAGGAACSLGTACEPRSGLCLPPLATAPVAPATDEDTLVEQRVATWSAALRQSVISIADATPASQLPNIYAPYVYNPALAATPMLDGANLAGTTQLSQLGVVLCNSQWSFKSPNASYSVTLGPRTIVTAGRPSTCMNSSPPPSSDCGSFYSGITAAWASSCGVTNFDPNVLQRSYVPCLAAASDWQVPASQTCQNLYDDEFNPDSTTGSYATFLARQCIPAPYDYVINTGGVTREIDTYLCPDAARLTFGWVNHNAELTACLTPGSSSLGNASFFSSVVVQSSGDLGCNAPGSTATSPVVLGELPLLDEYRDVSSPTAVGNPGDDDSQQTYADCLADLARAVPAASGAATTDLANATAAQKCASLGLFAASAETSRRTFTAYWLDLLRRWVAVHDFVAQQGRLQWESARVLANVDPGSSAQGDPTILYDLLDRLDHGWDYLLQPDTSRALVATRAYVASNPDYRLAYSPSATSLSPDHEQAKGFTFALYEGMVEYLKVLETLVAQLGAQSYAGCAAGQPPSEMVLARVGNALRYVGAVERLADALAAKNYSSTQTVNLLRARQEFRSYKRRVTSEAVDLAACKNPLGIDEQDLPLFFGDPADPDGRYFASSDYLATLVQGELTTATTSLTNARSAWESARTSRIQAQATDVAYQQRVEDLKVRYGDPVIAACGLTTVSAQDVLTTYDPSDKAKTAALGSCFLGAGCAQDSKDPSCFHGTLGEAVLTIRGAQQDVEAARKSWEDAQEAYDLKFQYCQSLSDNLKKDDALTEQHVQEMHNLRADKQAADTVATILDAATTCATGAVVSMGSACALAAGSAIAKSFSIDFQRQMDDATDEYNAQEKEIQNDNTMASCFEEAAERRLGIATAALQIQRRATDAQLALVRMSDLAASIRQSLNEGQAAVAREAARKVPSVAHNYWYEEGVLDYQRHFKRLQQLTFVELQAVEYEFQQSFDFRGGIVTAQVPDDLNNGAIAGIENVRKTRRAHGSRPELVTSVFSLRNDLLGLANNLNGTPIDPTLVNMRLADRLNAPQAAMYAQDGTYLGQAISFRLAPEQQITPLLVYGERLWDVAATLAGDNLGPNTSSQVYVMKRNTFLSKWYPGSGTTPYQVGRYRPVSYLFASDADVTNDARDLQEFMNALVLVPQLNGQRSDLTSNWPAQALNDAFAGEGLFGDYIVLIPQQPTTSPTWVDVTQIQDVLIRFDFYAVAGSPL